jgi:S-adenosyl methyltransferase
MSEAPAHDPARVGRPSPARVYDALLGGKDNYEIDRAAARDLTNALPEVRGVARANRGFLVRAVRYLAEQGIRQFIDLGTGFPTHPNVHEVARLVGPDARVVYVDNDPVVTAHNRALRASVPGVAAVHADIRHPRVIFDDPELVTLIDFGQPVAVLLIAVLHFIRDEEDPAAIVRAFRDRMAPGSYLAISHGVTDNADPATVSKITDAYSQASARVTPRTATEVARFFDGFELVEPGLADVAQWQPECPASAGRIRVAAAVGRRSDVRAVELPDAFRAAEQFLADTVEAIGPDTPAARLFDHAVRSRAVLAGVVAAGRQFGTR